MPVHRDWDPNKLDVNRYWYNIPYILLFNRVFFKEYENIFYISTSYQNHELINIFSCFDNVECVFMDDSYNLTEPSIWRMIPMWERNVELLFPRDVDSLLSISEYAFIQYFKSSTYAVGSLRSHKNHIGPDCLMLAGMSAFKPNSIPDIIKGSSFSEYYSEKDSFYGMDQRLMIKWFLKNEDFLKENFVDYYCDDNNQRQVLLDCESINIGTQNIESLNEYMSAEQNTLISWAGEPVDSRNYLRTFLESLFDKHDNTREIYNKIRSNTILKQFYKL